MAGEQVHCIFDIRQEKSRQYLAQSRRVNKKFGLQFAGILVMFFSLEIGFKN